MKNTFPHYCEFDSEGKAIIPLLGFLAGYGAGEKFLPNEFQVDDHLGKNGMLLVAAYQRYNGLSVEGGCGPEMRACLKRHKFDFEAIARLNGGETTFVQPDGTKIVWSPQIEAENDPGLRAGTGV